MTGQPDGGDGAPRFDLSSWWHLIEEVQRLGFETARGVADRFGDMADGAFSGRAGRIPQAEDVANAWQSFIERSGDPEMQERMVATAETMTKAAIDICQTAWDAVVESMPAGGFPGFGAPSPSSSGGGVKIGSTPPGHTVTGAVYIHLAAQVDAPKIALRASALHAGSGDVIDDAAIHLDPAEIDDPKPGESYRVGVSVDVPRDAAAGNYHGLLFTLIEPENVINLQLEVTDG